MVVIKAPIMSKVMKSNNRIIFWLLMQSYKVGTWIVLAVKNTCLTSDPCTSPLTLVFSECKCCFYFSLDGMRFSGRRCQVSISFWSHEMLQGLGGSSCWETNTGRKDEPTRVYLPSGSARWTTWKIYDPPVLYALPFFSQRREGGGGKRSGEGACSQF